MVVSSERAPVEEFKPIACLVAAAAIYAGTPNILDRLAYALNPESALRSLKDAIRIIDVGKRRNEIEETVERGGDIREYNVVKISVEENKEIKLYCSLPYTEIIIEKFIKDVRKDVSIARDIGALATYMALRARMR